MDPTLTWRAYRASKSAGTLGSSGRLLLLALLVLSQLAGLRAAQAQLAPVGPEFQVNTYTTSSQFTAAVAMDGAGNFVVGWESGGSTGSDASGLSIQARRYDSAGTPQGGEFQVNSFTPGFQGEMGVAASTAGFVATWGSSFGGAGPDAFDTVEGQRYDSTGTPQGGEFEVNTYITGSQASQAVAMDSAGNFVVVWYSAGSTGSDTSLTSVQGQRYDSAGTPQGGEFQVNTYTTGYQSWPAVAFDGAGNFVVVWESVGGDGSDTDGVSIHGQRYDSTGTPLGGEFQVNSYTTSDQSGPTVAVDGAGNFFVAWQSDGSAGSDTDGSSIQARRYDSTGTPLGGESQVNSYTSSLQRYPGVAADGFGGFAVVWASDGSSGPDTSAESIQGQHYDSAGTPQGAELQINTYTTAFQLRPTVAGDGAGNFVVAWHSYGSAGSDTSYVSVQAQRLVVGTTTTTSTSTSTTSSTLPTTDLLPGRIVIVKPGTLAKFVAKPVTGDTFALPTANPMTAGGSLRIFDVMTSAGDDAYNLPSGINWKGLGNPAGSKGYKYKGAGTPSDPCKVVLVKEKVIKAVCLGSGVTLTPPFTGDVGIILSLGTTDRYCAQFGGDDVKNDATLIKRKNAPAPAACP